MRFSLRRRGPGLACQQVVELVTDYLEGAMTRRERVRFERHLDVCPGCSAYLDQLRHTIEATGRLREDDIEPEVLDALVHAFRDHPRPG